MRIKYTTEFKQEAVNLVKEHGNSQMKAVRRLEISSKNINRWMLEGVQSMEFKKENERLRLDKEILKKAALFFANEKN